MTEIQWLQVAVQGGSFIVLAWMIWHTHTKTLPTMMEAFRHELAAERRQCREDHQRHGAALDKLTDAVTRLLTERIGRDGGIRG